MNIDGEEEKHENCAKRGEPHNLQGGELSEDVGRSTQWDEQESWLVWDSVYQVKQMFQGLPS